METTDPESAALLLLAADTILLVHFLFVCFVVFGLVLVFVGRAVDWTWIRNPWFRITHLLSIGIVVLQSWLGMICPLTVWEMALRRQAGDRGAYSGSFVAHWLDALLYYRAPPWIFVLVYTSFGLAVVASWLWIRPRSFRGSGGDPRGR